MSFASYDFLFHFLPFALAVVLVADRIDRERLLLPALILVSGVFYGMGSVPHLILLLSLIVVTWGVSRLYTRTQSGAWKRFALTVGIGINILALTVWKYGNSIVESWNTLGIAPVDGVSIIMPLGISFYAFQQVGYLLDLRRGRANWMGATDYLAFVLFFPQLLAGPIVTEKRMSREFAKVRRGVPLEARLDMALLGVAWFAMGLFKKVVLSDGLGRIVAPLIDRAAFGEVTSPDAWLIALAAPTRVYFDFCGYSDMAVGLALLVGIRIPANFNAPFRAKTSRQFWARWHITFHHFVRDHLYGPMIRATQGWRFGAGISLMVAVAISSVWHGSTVQFLLWGVFVWLSIVVTGAVFGFLPELARRIAMLVVTAALFMIMGVLFTTPSLDTATRVMAAMVSPSDALSALDGRTLLNIGIMAAALLYVRNEISTQVLLEAGHTHRDRHMFGWRPPVFGVNLGWAVALAVLLLVSFHFVGRSPDFVYFAI